MNTHNFLKDKTGDTLQSLVKTSITVFKTKGKNYNFRQIDVIF